MADTTPRFAFGIEARTHDDGVLLASAPARYTPVGSSHVMRQSQLDGSTALLPLEDAAFLAQCVEFGTLAAHAREISARFGTQITHATKVLQRLRAAGVLRPLAAWIDGPGAAARAPLPEPLIAIRTWHRPQLLARLLDSLVADERRFGVTRRYVVIDDGTKPELSHAVAAEVARFRRRTESPVYRVGPEHRAVVREALGSALTASERQALAELVDPAFPTGYTGSRSWNLALLASAGSSLSVLDDDLVFDVRLTPPGRPGIEIRDSVLSAVRFLDADADYARLPPAETDVLSELCQRVGQPALGFAPLHALDAAALRGRSSHELLPLIHHAPVLAAFGGNYGGFAYDSGIHLAYGSEDSMRDLWREPFDRNRLEGDHIWRGVADYRLLSRACYSPLLTDTRELMPFAGTWGRADDAYVLDVLAALVEWPLFLYTPHLVGHFPGEPRARLARALEQPLIRDLNVFVASEVRAAGAHLIGADRSRRLAALAAMIGNLADGTEAELHAALSTWIERDLCLVIRQLQQCLDQYPNAPTAWRDIATRMIAVNRVALGGEIDAETAATARRALAQFAVAASFWPRVWQRATDSPLLDDVVKPVS
jgi:hypothetical protein